MSNSKRRPFKKRRPPVGARPGTLMIPEGSPRPHVHVIRYDAEGVLEEDVPSGEKAASCLREGTVTWIDVQGLGDEAELWAIAKAFEIHPLALEDVVHLHQRPKTEQYPAHQLFVSRMAHDQEGEPLWTEQVSLFVGRNYVLTFQEVRGDVLDGVRQRIHQGKGPMRRSGPDYLAYAIIDGILDGYFPVAERLGERIQELEDELFSEPGSDVTQRIGQLRNDMLALRRGIWPQRDAINSLLRDPSPFLSQSVRVYLRDCYDHCVQLTDVLESYRELASGLMNTYLSVVANRTNEVMKVLTIMASIFIPLTFLAGIYGMNFEYMPELRVRWAYPALLGLMALSTLGMIVFFIRRGWLGRGRG